MQPPQGYAPPRKKDSSTIWIIVAVVVLLLVFGVGIMASLAIFGVRKYIANAKQAEALNSIGAISRDAVAAYEDDELGTTKSLCASASSPVPVSIVSVRAMKYQSSSADWQKDVPTSAGFACLKFEMSSPQYYQYDYQRTGSGSAPGDQFHAIAHGDLDGDGSVSTYVSTGIVDASGAVTIDPAPVITAAGE